MKHLTNLLVLCYLLNNLSAQTSTFSRVYGGDKYDDARSIVSTNDGCFVFTGLNKSGADDAGNMYLTKINAAGAVIWEKFYGYPHEDGGNFLIKTLDGGFLISGHTANTHTESACDGYLVKTDADGNKQWECFVGRQRDDLCIGAVQMEDGNFFVTGMMENREHFYEVLLCKISHAGEVIYLKSFGESRVNLYGHKIFRSPDGNLLIAGYRTKKARFHDKYDYIIEPASEDMYLLKCDTDGNVIWQNSFSTSGSDRAFGLTPLPTGGCIIAGGAIDEESTQLEQIMYVAKVNEDGTLAELKSVLTDVGEGYLYDIYTSESDGFVGTGMLRAYDEDHSRQCIVFLDDELEVQDYKVVASSSKSISRSVAPMWNGDYMLAGSLLNNDADILISRITMNAALAGIEDIDLQSYQLFPNPFTDFTYLRFENSSRTKVLTMFRMDGVIHRTITFEGNELLLYRNNLPVGNYVFQIKKPNGRLLTSGKMQVR